MNAAEQHIKAEQRQQLEDTVLSEFSRQESHRAFNEGSRRYFDLSRAEAEARDLLDSKLSDVTSRLDAICTNGFYNNESIEQAVMTQDNTEFKIKMDGKTLEVALGMTAGFKRDYGVYSITLKYKPTQYKAGECSVHIEYTQRKKENLMKRFWRGIGIATLLDVITIPLLQYATHGAASPIIIPLGFAYGILGAEISRRMDKGDAAPLEDQPLGAYRCKSLEDKQKVAVLKEILKMPGYAEAAYERYATARMSEIDKLKQEISAL